MDVVLFTVMIAAMFGVHFFFINRYRHTPAKTPLHQAMRRSHVLSVATCLVVAVGFGIHGLIGLAS